MNMSQFLNKIRTISAISFTINTFLSEWGDDLPVMLFGEIGRTIAINLSKFSIEECNDCFTYIEEGMHHGDEDLKNYIATGLLESLYNSSQQANTWQFIENALHHLSSEYIHAWISLESKP